MKIFMGLIPAMTHDLGKCEAGEHLPELVAFCPDWM